MADPFFFVQFNKKRLQVDIFEALLKIKVMV